MKFLMYDMAREQSWVGSYWQRIFPDIRNLGYTDLGLYIEQRYHFRSIPQHRPYGGVTPAQADEARRLCKKFGVRLSWFTNTLGHCDQLLANESLRHLAEDPAHPYQLCPSHPDTRPLVLNILREFAAINPSPILHIGGDEATQWNMDDICRRRKMTGAEFYLDHYRWVIRETKKLGKRPAMWGDMLLHHPDIAREIDRDVLIFDWHYDSGSADSIQFFHKLGFEVIPTTASNEYFSTFLPFHQVEQGIRPFMTEARELGCAGMCMSCWEMTKGAVFENQWKRLAAGTAIYEDKPLGNFGKTFFGSAHADESRLRPLLDESSLDKIHPCLGYAVFRKTFFADTPWPIYHLFGQKDAQHGMTQIMNRVRRARPIVASIRRAATRRKKSLRFLDLPLDLFEVAHHRIQTLRLMREVTGRIHPHRLPSARGAHLLKDLVRALKHHIEKSEALHQRFAEFNETQGGSIYDVLRLRRHIQMLTTVMGYVRYHAGAYAKGVPVPRHELWYV